MPPRPSPDIYAETLAVFERDAALAEPLTTVEVADALGAERRTVYKRLSTLVERGDLETKAVGSRGRVWWLPGGTEGAGPGTGAAFEATLETVRDGVATLDGEGRFVAVNEAFCEVTGYDREDLLGAHASLVHEALLEGRAAAEADRDAAPDEVAHDGGRTVSTATFSLDTDDGASTPVEYRSAPIHHEDGTPGRVVVVRDVSGRRERVRALELYERIVETIPDGVYALDPEGRFVLANDAYCTMTGYDHDELVGEHATLVTSDSVHGVATEYGEQFRSGERPDAVLDVDLHVAGGSTVPVESRFTHYEHEDGTEARCGVVRDVSERRARERALEESVRRTEAIVDNFPNGAVALFDRDLRYLHVGGRLFAELSLTPEDLQGRTLAEISPPSLVEEMAPHFEAVFDGERRQFEVALGESVREFHTLPVRDNRGEIFAGLGMSQDVTERREYERWLEAQRERLSTLNHLAAVVQNVTHAVIDQSSREEIEGTVCQLLADSDTFEFAWVAGVEPVEHRVLPRAEAGVEGYLEDWIGHAENPEDIWIEGPVGRAVRTGELQVTGDVFEEASTEVWREYAEVYGYRSVAAIPISHEDSLYGVLGLYASDPDAFDGATREILGHLGDVVGHAIASTERKQALLSDDLVELQFQIRDFFGTLGVPVSMDGRVTFERIVPVDDVDVLAYGVATGDGIDALEALVAGNPTWKAISVIQREGDSTHFVARVADPPTVSQTIANGGYLVQSVIEDGDSYVTVHLPASVDVREVVESVRASFPNLVMVSRRQVKRSRTPLARVQPVLREALTERQRTALEAAFDAGYFDRPRRSSGVEVADSLGITASTFHQHLRAAENKLVDWVLSPPAERPSDPATG